MLRYLYKFFLNYIYFIKQDIGCKYTIYFKYKNI
ncbi:hypothetical protein Bache_0349 [Bacteroides helcogenes P 36-108]|uniref:Uncharacterized protein n=1 Tax=Bacteroides helcogenes (strain ATCC 35417 / DSM 20613 / JCM 6297 / CCUG 15421 / P 36-108) TaxID=693979 RepID=E6SUG0_BACT6|nr:hypothetical protein Bache_0349 [Bacteroides helcogenes P 36-108]